MMIELLKCSTLKFWEKDSGKSELLPPSLYLKSIENITDRKWLLVFLTVWTKIAITLVPIYIGSALKFLILDDASFTVKMAVFRRLVAFSTFLLKNVFFYLHRGKIEDLIDVWDSYFKEDFHRGERAEKLRRNQQQTTVILSLSWIMTLTASLIYTLPPFFSKNKKLSHPSGIPYRHQSPDFELMVIFDFFRVVMACLSAVSLDCILMVFLSLVLVQLSHLKDTLTHMVSGISVDDLGHVVYPCGQQEIGKGVKESENFFFVRNITPLRRNLTNDKFPELVTKNCQYDRTVEKLEREMSIWILHHQQTIRFFQKLKDLFSPIASLQLLYVVFYTCFTAFHLARAKPGIDAFVIPFVASSNLISLFVWCRIGFYIDNIGSELFGDAFGKSWYLYPKRVQRVFSFIIMRGWKPLVLQGFSLIKINLFTLFEVFKITYQLFAFLMHVAHEE